MVIEIVDNLLKRGGIVKMRKRMCAANSASALDIDESFFIFHYTGVLLSKN